MFCSIIYLQFFGNVYLISIVSRGKVVKGRPLLTLSNILGLGETIVFFLRASFWIRNHFRPVNNHVLGQFTNLIDVLTNTINSFLLDLPVSKTVIRRFIAELENCKKLLKLLYKLNNGKSFMLIYKYIKSILY